MSSPLQGSPVLKQQNRVLGRAKRHVLQIGIAAGSVVLAAAATGAPSSEAASSRIIIGAVGDVSALSHSIRAPLANHAYGKLDGKVPVGKMISVKSVTSWRTVATSTNGTATYANIVRWARTIKSRPGPILLAFHHEPEASTNTHFGTASDYIAAYKRLVDIFRQQGVTNVEYTWQMTSWSFATKSSDRRYAAKWYPGDSYINNVATDPYNWYTCAPGRGRWNELRAIMDPSLAFARAHGKKLVISEFASQADTNRRALWLRNVHQYLIANRATIRAVFYFHHEGAPGCYWKLTTSGELSAMREMATDSTNFTAS